MSFLTNSPHIVRRVKGSNSREDLDSEICEGLRQVGDVGHTSAMMHLASGAQAPLDLTPQILKRRSRKSENGQLVQELNSIREGKYWDDAKGRWDPVLVRKAREKEMQYVKKHAVYEKSHHEPVLEGDRRSILSRQAGRTRTRERPSVRT